MYLPLALVPILVFVVDSACAARLPFDPPGSPRSSVPGATELKDVFRQRQARSADIVRRLKDGPNRKRQDPSAAATCSIASGTNVVQNPGFESADLAPWTDTVTGNPTSGVYYGYGYANTRGFALQNNDPSRGTVSLQQSVTVCAGVPFNVAFDLGFDDNQGVTCHLDFTISGDGFSTSFFSGTPCADGACTAYNTGGDRYARYNFPSAITFTTSQAASPVVVQAYYVCEGSTGPRNIYDLDNVVLARA